MHRYDSYPTHSATMPSQPSRIRMSSSQPAQTRTQGSARSCPSHQSSTAQSGRSSHSSHGRGEPPLPYTDRDTSSYSPSRMARSPRRGSATHYDTASFSSLRSEPHKKRACCGGYRSSLSDGMPQSFFQYEYTKSAPVPMIYAEGGPLDYHWIVSGTASGPITSYIGAQFAPVIEERAPRMTCSEPKAKDWALEEFGKAKNSEMLERWKDEAMIHGPFWADGEVDRFSSREQTLETYINSLNLPQ